MATLSLLLIAVGAILAFAVTAAVDDVDLVAVGVIMMVVGAIGVVVALLRSGRFGWSTRSEREVSADGRHVVERSSSTGL